MNALHTFACAKVLLLVLLLLQCRQCLSDCLLVNKQRFHCQLRLCPYAQDMGMPQRRLRVSCNQAHHFLTVTSTDISVRGSSRLGSAVSSTSGSLASNSSCLTCKNSRHTHNMCTTNNDRLLVNASEARGTSPQTVAFPYHACRHQGPA